MAPPRLATAGIGALFAMVGATPWRVAEAMGHAVAAGHGIRARPVAAAPSTGGPPATAWTPAAPENTRMTGRPAELQKFVHARRGAPAMDEAVRAMRAPEEKHRLAHDSAWRIRGASEMELAPAVTVATPVSTAGRTRPRRKS